MLGQGVYSLHSNSFLFSIIFVHNTTSFLEFIIIDFPANQVHSTVINVIEAYFYYYSFFVYYWMANLALLSHPAISFVSPSYLI